MKTWKKALLICFWCGTLALSCACAKNYLPVLAEPAKAQDIFIRTFDKSDLLRLVSENNPLPEDMKFNIKALQAPGQSMDIRAADHLERMLADGESQGLSFVVCSSFRSREKQETLFQQQIREQAAGGLSQREAYEAAKTQVALPGTSEHELGLAADIVAKGYQLLDEKQAVTKEAKWLRENCANYGFILRYPENKQHITGIIFEPWHFRYVGVEAAKEIMSSGLCLEEYLDR